MLTTTNLTKKYKELTALDNVSITVEQGDVYGLIGKNGAGKTTLLKLVMGLSAPTSGEIAIANSRHLNDARRRIGFMIGQSFFPYLSARQNIEHHRVMKGIKDKRETERVLKLVDMYGVKKPFKSFSMGMKQRLGIANALLGNPPIVILDEPVNGLDPQGIIDIRQLIKDVNAAHGTTFIISSHILSELDLVATKFGIINEGVLLKEITHDELHRYTGKQDKKPMLIEVDNAEKALEILKANGLKPRMVKQQETTLEEYFFELIGGRHNG